MGKKNNFFSRFFSNSKGDSGKRIEQSLLANYQREAAESHFDAEMQLNRILEQLRSAWDLDALHWSRDNDSADSASLNIQFSGETLGDISWIPHKKLASDQLETLEILSGLAAPHLSRSSLSVTTPLQKWHSTRADPVTGLLNRSAFLTLLAEKLTATSSKSASTSVLTMIQISDYDKIYKEMGGLGYDKCVQEFSNLLKTSFGLHSTAGRIEEDIFVVVVSDVVDPDKVSEMCSSFRKKASQVLDIDIILGMAPLTETYSDPKVWFNDARTALKQIQKSGGQQAFLSQTMQGNSIARWRMESDLEQALQSNQVETWFQPIVNLENGKAVGYEALCRWTHPQKGPISPAEFIPIAENEGPLILEIGKLTLKQSCETLAKLTEDRNEDLFMSINLSPVQLLKDRLLAQHIQKTIRGANLDPRKIKFEVTETAVMHEKEKAIEALQRIRQTGAKISMDDFGTGYSSLAHLKEFPISTLKIDRSFVAGSDHNDEARAMLNTIIELARGLELDVVAEGIETEGERDLLIDLGCGYGQGWLFGKPLPPDDL